MRELLSIEKLKQENKMILCFTSFTAQRTVQKIKVITIEK